MNPYQILGVSPSMSDDEIKSQYRKLSRKYHPDANVGSPNQKAYEEKFKEIQQAYQTIMDERQGKTPRAGNGYEDFYRSNGFGNAYSGGFGAGQGAYETQDDAYLRSAENYISSGYYREGLNVLNQIKNKTGAWYYYSAYANYGLNNNVIAKEHIAKAMQMEPNNMYYRALAARISGGEMRYEQRSNYYGGNPRTVRFGGNGMRYCCYAIVCANLCFGGAKWGLPLLCCI